MPGLGGLCFISSKARSACPVAFLFCATVGYRGSQYDVIKSVSEGSSRHAEILFCLQSACNMATHLDEENDLKPSGNGDVQYQRGYF